MNERIKELIDQCSEYDEMSMGIWFNKEKFAELIVKECILAVRKADRRHAITTWDMGQYQATLEKAERSINETVLGKVYAD